MTEVARYAGNAAVTPMLASERASVLAIDGTLDVYLRRYAADGSVGVLAPGVVKSAQARLRQLGGLLARAERAACYKWLDDFVKGVERPGTPAERGKIAENIQAIWEACCELPAAVWCDETRIAFSRVQRFWPLPADVYAFLEPYGDALKRQRTGCLAVIKAWERAKGVNEQPEKAMPSEAALQEVRDAVNSLRVPTTGNITLGFGDSPTMPSARASVLSDHALLAAYEQQMPFCPPDLKRAHQTRIDRLRDKLGLVSGA